MMSSWKDLQEAIECGDVKGIKKYVADGLDVNRINQVCE